MTLKSTCHDVIGIERATAETQDGTMTGLSSFATVAPPLHRHSDVRFGSKADIPPIPPNVRFTPKSGHRRVS
jgi:hypothetical protein